MNVCNFGVRGLKNSKVKAGQSGETEVLEAPFVGAHAFIRLFNKYLSTFLPTVCLAAVPAKDRGVLGRGWGHL